MAEVAGLAKYISVLSQGNSTELFTRILKTKDINKLHR